MLVMEKKQKSQKKSLKQEYAELADKYASAFSLKYLDGSDYYWIGDEIGGTIDICDYVVAYCDIRYCIDNSVSDEDFFSWLNYGVSVGMISQDIGVPTLHEWVNGNHGIGDEKLNELEEAAMSLRLAKAKLDELVEECTGKKIL